MSWAGEALAPNRNSAPFPTFNSPFRSNLSAAAGQKCSDCNDAYVELLLFLAGKTCSRRTRVSALIDCWRSLPTLPPGFYSPALSEENSEWISHTGGAASWSVVMEESPQVWRRGKERQPTFGLSLLFGLEREDDHQSPHDALQTFTRTDLEVLRSSAHFSSHTRTASQRHLTGAEREERLT